VWLGLSLLLIGCGEPSAAIGTTLAPADATDPAESTLETPTPVAEEATPTPIRPTATATRIPRPTAALASAPSGSPASPTPGNLPIASGFNEETVFVYYTITGRTATELRAQMERLGPGGTGAGHYDATAQWDLNWAYRGLPGPYGCAIDSIGVRAKITLTLPQWEPPADVPAALHERWQVFLAALLVHEEGHRQIAIAHGRELVNVLQALPPTPTCDGLKPAVDAAAKGVLDRLARADAEYDRRTRHGLSQGTRFP
jgi:predicted secreted Zn-dependent protease